MELPSISHGLLSDEAGNPLRLLQAGPHEPVAEDILFGLLPDDGKNVVDVRLNLDGENQLVLEFIGDLPTTLVCGDDSQQLCDILGRETGVRGPVYCQLMDLSESGGERILLGTVE